MVQQDFLSKWLAFHAEDPTRFTAYKRGRRHDSQYHRRLRHDQHDAFGHSILYAEEPIDANKATRGDQHLPTNRPDLEPHHIQREPNYALPPSCDQRSAATASSHWTAYAESRARGRSDALWDVLSARRKITIFLFLPHHWL
jgi:hypothetical protein